jgi:hypothetical protein
MSEKTPNSEELLRIQKDNLTEEQILEDKEREGAYNAGKVAGRKQILTKKEYIKFFEDKELLADKIGLSGELRELYIAGELIYGEAPGGRSVLWSKMGVPENQIIEFIKLLPKLDFCGITGFLTNNKIISENIIKTIVEKFPNAVFGGFESLDADEEYWKEKIKSMGGKIEE